MWLAKGSNANRALRWVRDSQGRVKTTIAKIVQTNGRSITVRRPQFEVFAPKRPSEVDQGTVARGAVTCPVTGYTTPVASVRRQLQERLGGTRDARLLAVRESNPKLNDRVWRQPSDIDGAAIDAATVAAKTLTESDSPTAPSIPGEKLPPQGTLGFRVQLYGILKWGDLFTARQLVALTTLSSLIKDASKRIRETHDEAFADAVQCLLSLALGRLTDFTSSCCVMKAMGNRGVVHTFGRQALPIVWDFAETNPLNASSASWLNMIDYMERAIEPLCVIKSIGHAEAADAAKHPLFDGYAACIVTDPPYYDSVPYADLSDYFYVWLKRIVPISAGFTGYLTPKSEECIVDPSKGKDKAFYERTMSTAMAESRRILSPTGIGVVVFAHKSTSGWEAQLRAIINAGWIVTGSWPIDTEQPTRLRARDSAALASSIHLVCRPREGVGDIANESIGEWRDVLGELPKRIHEWMPRLAAEGVVGADAIFACLGPALEIFSRYSRVEKANGEPATLREYLEFVWAAVSTEALSLIFKDADASGLEPDARLTAMWLWTLGGGASNGSGKSSTDDVDEAESDSDEDEEFSGSGGKVKPTGGFTLEYDAARKIAQGLGVHLEQSQSLVEVKGDKARLLPVSERAQHLFGKGEGRIEGSGGKPKKKAQQRSLFEELGDVEAAEAGWTDIKGPSAGATVLDRVHQSMILFAANRGELLKRFLLEDGVGKDARFWKLADNLNKLYPSGTEERRWVEGVLARKKGLGQ